MSLNTHHGATAVPPDRLQRSAKLFGFLADPIRLRLLLQLGRGERNVTALQAVLRLSQSTVSHHLLALRQAGLVARRRAGKEMHYVLAGKADAGTGTVLALAADGLRVRVDRDDTPPPAKTPGPLNERAQGLTG